MSGKIQRMQKRLAELLAVKEKHLAKAQEASTAAEQLKRDILFEENNAIAAKLRDSGMTPEEFDAIIVNYLSQRKKDDGEENQNVAATAKAPPEVTPSEKAEETAEMEDSSNDS